MSSPLLKLRILHTNDLHSHFEQMPSIAAAFRELRAADEDMQTLTLDIGDHLDRMRPETEGSGGMANMAVLNATGYEVIALGNNEGLTFTKEALQSLYASDVQFKVLCSNLSDASTGDYPEWGTPYHIVEKSGIRIGLIGVTAYFTDYYRLLGWEIGEPLAAVKRWVRELGPQTDLIIVLSHIGLRNDERMAAEIPGIHLILGGHTHHLLEQPLRIGDTMICAAGKFGQYLGVVDVELDPGTRKPVAMNGYVRTVSDYPRDPEVAAVIERWSAKAQQALSREVALLEQPLAAEWYEEAPLGSLLAGGLRKQVGGDIGLVNAGQLLDGLAQGPVTAGRLLEICPSPINPCRVILTGRRIKQALEESLLPEFMEKPLYGFGFRGKVLGMLNVDGLQIEYDPDAPDYKKIVEIRVGEEPLSLDNEYTVATIDMFTFGIGYTTLSQGKDVRYYLPQFLRDLLEEELKDRKAVERSDQKHWKRTASPGMGQIL